MLSDRIAWAKCWACYHLYMALPIKWRVSWALLPHAGSYAYQSFGEFRETRAKIKHGGE